MHTPCRETAGREWPRAATRVGGARLPTPAAGCCHGRPPEPRPPTEPCQAPPPFCTHTQHDTGPVTRTQHPTSGRRAGRPPTHRRGWQGGAQMGAAAESRPGGPHTWHFVVLAPQSRPRGQRARPAEGIRGQAAREAPLRLPQTQGGPGSTNTQRMRTRAQLTYVFPEAHTHSPLGDTHTPPSHSCPPPTRGSGVYKQPPRGHGRADTRRPRQTLSALSPFTPLSPWRP